MDALDINTLLHRSNKAQQLIDFLNNFDTIKDQDNAIRGVYIYGNTGCGKTWFVQEILKHMNYDIVRYDAGDVRTKKVIEKMGGEFTSNMSVISLLSQKPKKLATIMDEMDGINNGDKGGIEAIVKLVRAKKTKKQRSEGKTPNPIICIGNGYIDKKIQKLMDVCVTINLESPTSEQMRTISQKIHPSFTDMEHENIVQYVQGDLRKMAFVHNTYLTTQKKPLAGFCIAKVKSLDTRQVVSKLLTTPTPLCDHGTVINSSDRSSVSLLWHENIIDALAKHCTKKQMFECYVPILSNLCFADCLDKWKLQYQIWQFSEIKSIIGTFKSAHLYHKMVAPFHPVPPIRFTKILTKFANEFGNKCFLYLTCCPKFCGDIKDLWALLSQSPMDSNVIQHICKTYNVEDTEVKRLYKFLDKYTKHSAAVERDLITINTFSLVNDEED